MAKIVVPCVHCGKPVPVDSVDKEDLQNLLEPIKNAIMAQKPPDLKPILDALGTLQPPKPLNTCEGGTCEHEKLLRERDAELEATKSLLGQTKASLETFESGDFTLPESPDFVERVLDAQCQGNKCVGDWAMKYAKTRGLVEPKTEVKEPPKTEEPGTEKMPWEE